MLSSTVIHGSSENCWKTTARSGPGPLTSRPSTTTCPSSFGSRPAMIRSNVVLPQPDGPSSETNSLSLTSKDTSRRTGVTLGGVPKTFLRPVTLITMDSSSTRAFESSLHATHEGAEEHGFDEQDNDDREQLRVGEQTLVQQHLVADSRRD